ncbi:MAG: siderophore-interacting protein [Actinobacteria bacterium]|nr:siderophore-interacting protein [Actinomycetota bacterium]
MPSRPGTGQTGEDRREALDTTTPAGADSRTGSLEGPTEKELPRVTTITGRTPAHHTEVTRAVGLTSRMRRITLAGPTLVGLAPSPAQDIEIILGDEAGRRVKRRYTIRRARPESGQFDVDALVHPHGPGGRWAASVQPGDQVEFLGPRGRLELREAGWHLFVADEAGLPAVAALCEALGPGARTVGLIEVGDQHDEIELGVTSLRWLHRGKDEPGRPDRFAAALSAMTSLAPDGQAYLLGESRVVISLRPLIEALAIDPIRTYVKGYWNVGRGRARPIAGGRTRQI